MNPNTSRPVLLLCVSLALAGCRQAPLSAPAPRDDSAPLGLVPMPASVVRLGLDQFSIDSGTAIVLDSEHPEATRTAELLVALLRPSTGFALPVFPASNSPRRRGTIALRLDASRVSLGAEGYELRVDRDSVRILAKEPAGLFYGTQTLRQLLPPAIESHMTLSPRSWTVPSVTVVDQPRFAWRGAMLDVARHFFTAKEVRQYIDLLALYKLNVLHLHLSDDQGWRIEIKSRPKLALTGGATQVGGGMGGFYTQAEFSEIVEYARARHVMIVPEIDLPGHTNAALVAYPELSCSRRPTALYTGTDVGWSTLCVEKEETYALIDDIVREISALTPGPYFHMGGDEVEVLTPAQYATFVERVQGIVARHGKHTIGWEEIAKARLRPTTLVQNWRTDSAGPATAQGAKIIVSPGPKMYLDMKYDANTELGLRWAGLIEVRDVYDWDPATYMKGATERDMVGLEAPLWSETIRNMAAAMYLAVPRLPALAEVGWTPQSAREWRSFQRRIAAQAPRWRYLGVNYYRSPQIPW